MRGVGVRVGSRVGEGVIPGFSVSPYTGIEFYPIVLV